MYLPLQELQARVVQLESENSQLQEMYEDANERAIVAEEDQLDLKDEMKRMSMIQESLTMRLGQQKRNSLLRKNAAPMRPIGRSRSMGLGELTRTFSLKNLGSNSEKDNEDDDEDEEDEKMSNSEQRQTIQELQDKVIALERANTKLTAESERQNQHQTSQISSLQNELATTKLQYRNLLKQVDGLNREKTQLATELSKKFAFDMKRREELNNTSLSSLNYNSSGVTLLDDDPFELLLTENAQLTASVEALQESERTLIKEREKVVTASINMSLTLAECRAKVDLLETQLQEAQVHAPMGGDSNHSGGSGGGFFSLSSFSQHGLRTASSHGMNGKRSHTTPAQSPRFRKLMQRNTSFESQQSHATGGSGASGPSFASFFGGHDKTDPLTDMSEMTTSSTNPMKNNKGFFGLFGGNSMDPDEEEDEDEEKIDEEKTDDDAAAEVRDDSNGSGELATVDELSTSKHGGDSSIQDTTAPMTDTSSKSAASAGNNPIASFFSGKALFGGGNSNHSNQDNEKEEKEPDAAANGEAVHDTTTAAPLTNTPPKAVSAVGVNPFNRFFAHKVAKEEETNPHVAADEGSGSGGDGGALNVERATSDDANTKDDSGASTLPAPLTDTTPKAATAAAGVNPFKRLSFFPNNVFGRAASDVSSNNKHDHDEHAASVLSINTQHDDGDGDDDAASAAADDDEGSSGGGTSSKLDVADYANIADKVFGGGAGASRSSEDDKEEEGEGGGDRDDDDGDDDDDCSSTEGAGNCSGSHLEEFHDEDEKSKERKRRIQELEMMLQATKAEI